MECRSDETPQWRGGNGLTLFPGKDKVGQDGDNGERYDEYYGLQHTARHFFDGKYRRQDYGKCDYVCYK